MFYYTQGSVQPDPGFGSAQQDLIVLSLKVRCTLQIVMVGFLKNLAIFVF